MPLEVTDGSCELVVRVVEYAVPVPQDAASAGIQWHPGQRRRREAELNVESGREPVSGQRATQALASRQECLECQDGRPSAPALLMRWAK